MRPVVTVAEMRALDAAALEITTHDELVERAGRAVAEAVLDRCPSVADRTIVVVAGKGSNGADGRVAARLLEAKGASVKVLDATFWDSPFAIRLANHEHGYGFDRIHAHRVARVPGPGTKEKRLRLDIVTVGRDIATVTLVYKVRGRDMTGRQMQTWVRFPDAGWKVIAAHVSMIGETPVL